MAVVAYQDVTINEQAWNGFKDMSCVLCDQDFDNENIHKNEKKHILKLIQSKIEFGDGKSIYRLVRKFVISLMSTFYAEI